ncbi:hypothetical protein Q8G35_03335 [Peribacillus simplex]|uniref:Uncharacterized protein n=2 Tax=Peribacillus TaxID=2675229 RepID=A0AA90P723_9BACI|nr:MULTISPECIES: hypothetical protein [Peribacillus]MDP1417438.1 hypothetical protein [Peribacillus simplex]MDP1450093.1 hypothetical protein [Peribacillus frigoritolerans]
MTAGKREVTHERRIKRSCNGTPETPAIETPEAKTFTQAEVDKILTDRIARANRKLEKFADYDDVKTKASEYEKLLEEKRLAELSKKGRLEEIAKKRRRKALLIAGARKHARKREGGEDPQRI